MDAVSSVLPEEILDPVCQYPPPAALPLSMLDRGRRLDHYRIEERICDSAGSSLFRATDLDTGNSVALKVPHLEAESDLVFFERFRREATIGRELNHPSLPKVFPQDGQSSVYIAMEWIEAPTLRALLARSGKLPVADAVQIATQICEALQYIHAQGIVHRDLKPENIVIVPNAGIKLLDFGIAAKVGVRRITFGKLSAVMGTPDYISPEQVKGKRGDARSDLYALGVILFEMLTGGIPFRGSNPFAIMNDRLLNDPLPLRQLDPSIHPGLEAIVRRALARDPAARYQNASELCQDLAHPEAVSEFRPCKQQGSSLVKRLMVFSGLAMLPTSVFLLLLYMAHRQ
jgi:serine/threonine protein kinase